MSNKKPIPYDVTPLVEYKARLRAVTLTNAEWAQLESCLDLFIRQCMLARDNSLSLAVVTDESGAPMYPAAVDNVKSYDDEIAFIRKFICLLHR